MTKIVLNIETCKGCPFFKEERFYTEDSFDLAYDWFCQKKSKKIAGYVSWNEDNSVKVPSWCPLLLHPIDEKTLRPCDCVDQRTVEKLNEQGIGHNDESITVEPNSVVLRMGNTSIKIWMKRFKMFAEWYLEPQKIK